MVTVRYYAGARAAAGRSEEEVRATTVADLKAALAGRGADLERVLKVATLLVDGRACRDEGQVLAEGATVEVLPPFAGG